MTSPSTPSLPFSSSIVLSAASTPPRVTVNKDGTLQLPNGLTYKITHLNTTIAGTSVPVPIPAELNPAQIEAIQNFVNTIFSQIDESELKQANIHTVKLTTVSNEKARIEKASADNTILGSRDVSIDTSHATTAIRNIFHTVVSSAPPSSLTGTETRASTVATSALTPTPRDSAEPAGLPSAALSAHVSGIVLQAADPSPTPASTPGDTPVIPRAAPTATSEASLSDSSTTVISHPALASRSSVSDSVVTEATTSEATPVVEKDKDIDTKPGAVITHSYKMGDREYGTQTIVRTDCLDNARLFFKNMLSQLTNKLQATPPPTDAEKLKLEKELSLYKKEFANLNKMNLSEKKLKVIKKEIKSTGEEIEKIKKELQSNNNSQEIKELKGQLKTLEDNLKALKSELDQNKTWLDSNYFRDLIRKHGDFNKAIEEYVSAPINMRQQQLKLSNGEEVGFCRLGVISDMRNGWFSLADLQAIKQAMPNTRNIVQPMLEKVYSQLPGLSKIDNPSQKQIDEALKKLPLLKRQSAERALDQLRVLKNAPQELIDELIADRKRILEQQMIQVIAHQAKENPELLKKALEEGKPFNMMHVGLLNQRTSKFDETGWMHDERVEIEDMREIFKAFRGKNLVLDGTGPLIDGDNIHLPSIPGFTDENRRVVVNPYFLNLSVQGNMENNGRQLELNKEELGEFLLEDPRVFSDEPNGNDIAKQIMGLKDIPKAEAGYPLAEDLLMVLLAKKKVAVSLGCLSAKDRTGVIGGRLMLRHVQPHAKSLGAPSKDVSELESREFNASGAAVRVVQDNTKAKGLKVHIKANLRMKTANKVNLYAKAGAISIPGISGLYNRFAGVPNT